MARRLPIAAASSVTITINGNVVAEFETSDVAAISIHTERRDPESSTWTSMPRPLRRIVGTAIDRLEGMKERRIPQDERVSFDRFAGGAPRTLLCWEAGVDGRRRSFGRHLRENDWVEIHIEEGT